MGKDLLVCRLGRLVHGRVALWHPVQPIEIGVRPPGGVQSSDIPDSSIGFRQSAPLGVVAHRQGREVFQQEEVIVGSEVHDTRVASRHADRNARRQLTVEMDLALVESKQSADLTTTGIQCRQLTHERHRGSFVGSVIGQTEARDLTEEADADTDGLDPDGSHRAGAQRPGFP